jgi:hypothetical protein
MHKEPDTSSQSKNLIITESTLRLCRFAAVPYAAGMENAAVEVVRFEKQYFANMKWLTQQYLAFFVPINSS